MDQPIKIPISKRHYLIGLLLPVGMLIVLVVAYFSSAPAPGKQCFFGGFAAFCLLFSGLQAPYLLKPSRYAMQIGPDGIVERTPLKTVVVDWANIESIKLQSIDGGRRQVTYRLHKRTITRWFSFGRIDYSHYNQYAIGPRQLFRIIDEQFARASQTAGNK